MTPQALLIPASDHPQAGLFPEGLAPDLLAGFLELRLAAEEGRAVPGRPPAGARRELFPRLPRAGHLALRLFLNRNKVQSYPLLFTTLALAHPN